MQGHMAVCGRGWNLCTLDLIEKEKHFQLTDQTQGFLICSTSSLEQR
jgi:hypothetical protein